MWETPLGFMQKHNLTNQEHQTSKRALKEFQRHKTDRKIPTHKIHQISKPLWMRCQRNMGNKIRRQELKDSLLDQTLVRLFEPLLGSSVSFLIKSSFSKNSASDFSQNPLQYLIRFLILHLKSDHLAFLQQESPYLWYFILIFHLLPPTLLLGYKFCYPG